MAYFYITTNCAGETQYLGQDMIFTSVPTKVSIIFSQLGNKFRIGFSANRFLGIAESKISDTMYNLDMVPINDDSSLWNIELKVGNVVNISSESSPKIYLSMLSELRNINNKPVYTCKLIGSTIPTGSNMNLNLIPVDKPVPTQVPTQVPVLPNGSSSKSNNLPIILGVTIPVAVLLLAVGGYFLFRKARKAKLV